MRKSAALLAALLAVFALAVPVGASGGGAHPDHVTVIDGADRYETAATIALNARDNRGAPTTLYIANGETLVDAIVLGANTVDESVLLLVARDTVPAATAEALRRIGHAELVFLGGDDAISPEVRAEVASLTDNYAYPS